MSTRTSDFLLQFLLYIIGVYALLCMSSSLLYCQEHFCLSSNCFSEESYDDYIKQIEKIQAKYATNRSSGNNDEIIIPVVVHVLYNTAQQNISNQQIFSQIDILNDAFSLENPNIRNKWPQAADVDIKFVLANRDPNGDPTNGITRTSTNVQSFIINLNENVDFPQNTFMKTSSTGGKDGWPKDDYLNIWVINMPDNLKGFATFPGVVQDHIDGVVMQYQFFGNTGTGTSFPAYSEGKSCVHEVGHWLNIAHPWGFGNNCTVNDGIADTPRQERQQFSCDQDITECGNILMLENYMQYTNDPCQSVFTEDQKVIMRDLFSIGGFRESICDLNGYIENTGATISGKIWEDQNADNIYSANENEVPNIEVRLFSCTGQFLESTTSNSTGDFQFINLTTQSYFIRVTASDLPTNLGPHPFWLSDDNCFTIIDNGVYGTNIPLLQLARIESLVWEDLNANGLKENNEPGLQNRTVLLKDTDGEILQSVNSNSNGEVVITDIYPSLFYLEYQPGNQYNSSPVNQGNGSTAGSNIASFFGNNTSQLFELSPNQTFTSVNAAFYQYASLKGQVWVDNNQNGIFDANEDGAQGLNIQLLDNQSSIVTSETIGTDGTYEFNDLVPGQYSLEFRTSDNFSAIDNLSQYFSSNNDVQSETITLVSNQDMSNLNGTIFEEIAASISGKIWIDNNDDGNPSFGESNQSNIEIQLFSCDRTFVTSTQSNASGDFEFQDLALGNYYLTIKEDDVANGIGPHPSWIMGQNCISLTEEKDYEQNIPLLALASVEGNIWEDINGDGIFTSNEPSINNIEIEIKEEDGSTSYLLESDGFGNYTYENIYPGTYYLEFDIPQEFQNTFSFQGNNSNIDNDFGDFNGVNTTQLMEFVQEDEKRNIDGGFYKRVRIGQKIWHDENANGLQENNEEGLSNFEITLHRNNSGSWEIQESRFSDANGNFVFESAPGEYFISITETPENFVPTIANIGNNESIDSDINTQDMSSEFFQLESGEESMLLAAGFFLGARLGGVVWMDDDRDGIKDAQEEGLDDVIVTVYNIDDEFIDQVFTNSLGEYAINSLTPDDYYMELNVPNQTTVISQPDIENYYNHTNGINTTQYFNLTSGSEIVDVNAGLELATVDIFNINFNASIVSNGTMLSWDILSDGFIETIELQRYDGSIWQEIHTTEISTEYAFTDENTYYESSYYRLKILELSGKVTYSNVIFIDNTSETLIQSYVTNPFNSELIISLQGKENSKYKIQILSIQNGQTIQTIEGLMSSKNEVLILKTVDIPAGAYMLFQEIGGKQNSQIIIKQ